MNIRIPDTLKAALTLFLLFAIASTGIAQNATELPKAVNPADPAKESEEFKKETIAFLREAAADVNSLRSPENRISFSSELASLMWNVDEKEARAMFQGVISDFRMLLGQYDARLNAADLAKGGAVNYGGSLLFGDDSEAAKAQRKIRVAIMVRQQIAQSMADHDPQVALDFYYDSLNAITNPERRKEFESQDEYFVAKLLGEIADSNAAKAAEMAKKSLGKGLNYQHLELLKKVYAKDADKGAELGDEIAKRLKDQGSEAEVHMYILPAFLDTGIDNYDEVKKAGNKKKTMFSEQNLRDMSETLAQRLLKADPEDSDAMSHVSNIERFAPSRAAQIRAKFGVRATATASGSGGSGRGISNTMAPPPPRYTASGDPNANVSAASTEADRAREAKREADEKVMKDVAGLGSKKIPKEERDKIVDRARAIVSEMGSKDEKIMSLSMLAAQVAKAGDKELANEIMRDAAGFVNPQPKNYKDYILVWMLASGYAEADPEKAFPLLDDALYRLNDTITGMVRVAEFIDVTGEIVDDGEVQVGAFGGSMIREMTRGLGMVNGTLTSLAKADIEKTKALTNRFDRSEVRALAKMLVLRALLKKDAKPEIDPTSETFPEDMN